LFGAKPKTIAVDATAVIIKPQELIKEHWTPATKGALIASPSNPTGTLLLLKN